MAWFYVEATKDYATDEFTSATVWNEQLQVVYSFTGKANYNRLVRDGDIKRQELGFMASALKLLIKAGIAKEGDRMRRGRP